MKDTYFDALLKQLQGENLTSTKWVILQRLESVNWFLKEITNVDSSHLVWTRSLQHAIKFDSYSESFTLVCDTYSLQDDNIHVWQVER